MNKRITLFISSDCDEFIKTAKQKLDKEFDIFDSKRHIIDGSSDEDKIIGINKDISNSDFIILDLNRPTWNSSICLKEAYDQAVPVYGVCSNEDPAFWLRYYCNLIYKTLDELCTGLLIGADGLLDYENRE